MRRSDFCWIAVLVYVMALLGTEAPRPRSFVTFVVPSIGASGANTRAHFSLRVRLKPPGSPA